MSEATANMVQAAILVCSSTVALLVGSKMAKTRRIGFCFGLAGQPFWMATSWSHGQWAIFALSFWYTFCYVRGLWNTREESK